MHIVLLILKILGIILLVLFGLLLLVLCTVLFVPVRYQISGSWKEEKWGRVRVSWLLSAICVNGSYEKRERASGIAAGAVAETLEHGGRRTDRASKRK